jgi:hypothetical protein
MKIPARNRVKRAFFHARPRRCGKQRIITKAFLFFVMPALVAGIHVLKDRCRNKTWMAGTRPAMTIW